MWKVVKGLGVAKNKYYQSWNKERNKALKKLYNKGLSDEEIAKKIGGSKGSVKAQRNRLRLNRQRGIEPAIKELDIHNIRKLEKAGKTREEIGKVYGVAGPTVYKFLKDYEELEKKEQMNENISSEHIKFSDILKFKLEEGKKYLINYRKNIGYDYSRARNGLIGISKIKIKVLKNYDDHILIQRGQVKECIQKIDFVSGKMEYEEV